MLDDLLAGLGSALLEILGEFLLEMLFELAAEVLSGLINSWRQSSAAVSMIGLARARRGILFRVE
jgi:hypothetical protein